MKHAKSLEHHAKAGDALRRGDTKTAMHHLGHVMADCRKCAREEAAGVPLAEIDHDEHVPEKKAAPQSSLRDRLKGFKKS